MAGETELMDQGARIARDVGAKAVQSAGGFGSGLLKSPLTVFGNVGRGVWDSVLTYGLPIAGITGVLGLIAPDYLRGAAEAVGREDLAEKAADGVEKNGVMHLALMAGGAGLAGGAAIGALKGMWQSVTGSGPQSEPSSSTGESIGSAIGSVVTFGAIAAVTIGALKSSGVSHDEKAGNDVQVPPVPKAQSQQALDA